MHLKNFSLITTSQNIIQISPVYDLLNTTIAQPNTREEFALPLQGKKSNLTRNDLIRYFGSECLQLNSVVMEAVLRRIRLAIPHWKELIERSYLSVEMKNNYLELLRKRVERLELV